MQLSSQARCFVALTFMMCGSVAYVQPSQFPAGPRPISAGFFDPDYARTQNRQHLGADFMAPEGTPVFAPIDGKVVINATDKSDVMEAYMVIRNLKGIEHVLGHLASPYKVGTSVKIGQEIGTVRKWPGQPRRSHVHWGVNRSGVTQAMNGGWGWGRAPLSATMKEAIERGWSDAISDLSVAAANTKYNQIRRTEILNRIASCKWVVASKDKNALSDLKLSDPVINAVTWRRNRRASWNGVDIDQRTFRAFLDHTASMNPRPYLLVSEEDGIDQAVLAEFQKLLAESRLCG